MSEYNANKQLAFYSSLLRLEARISQGCEPGYDPYNSADRFKWPVFVDEPPLGPGPMPPDSFEFNPHNLSKRYQK